MKFIRKTSINEILWSVKNKFSSFSLRINLKTKKALEKYPVTTKSILALIKASIGCYVFNDLLEVFPFLEYLLQIAVTLVAKLNRKNKKNQNSQLKFRQNVGQNFCTEYRLEHF